MSRASNFSVMTARTGVKPGTRAWATRTCPRQCASWFKWQAITQKCGTNNSRMNSWSLWFLNREPTRRKAVAREGHNESVQRKLQGRNGINLRDRPVDRVRFGEHRAL